MHVNGYCSSLVGNLTVGVFWGVLQSKLEEQGLEVMLNDLSNTVVFERPASEDLIIKWQLACEGNHAHVVVMSHVTESKIEAFVSELAKSRKRSV
jgi:histidine decarboxylase